MTVNAAPTAASTDVDSTLLLDVHSTKCSELLLREICSFYRSVLEQFGIDEAEKALEDWFEHLEEITVDECDITRRARSATIRSADRLAARICSAFGKHGFRVGDGLLSAESSARTS